jgi:hypothetical protein
MYKFYKRFFLALQLIFPNSTTAIIISVILIHSFHANILLWRTLMSKLCLLCILHRAIIDVCTVEVVRK